MACAYPICVYIHLMVLYTPPISQGSGDLCCVGVRNHMFIYGGRENVY